jgi:hypothetical protein
MARESSARCGGTVSLSKQKRRSLQRRADRLLTNLRGSVVSAPADVSPRTCALLLTERTRPTIVTRSNIQRGLQTIGLHFDRFDEILAEIKASAEDDGAHYPVLLLIDGWLQVSFVEAISMSRGGVA